MNCLATVFNCAGGTTVAWFQQYENWTKHVDDGRDYWACPYYIWTDDSLQYYRHLVYYNPHIITGLNTQDYFYFKDVDNNVYWCRCQRGGLTQLRWSYLQPADYRSRMAMLSDKVFPAGEAGRSLSIAGANPPPSQLADLAFTQQPPQDPFGNMAQEKLN
jgi:hypothetical protein